MEQLTNVAKYFKLKSERRGRMTKGWLSLEDCGAFMAKLSVEMIHNGILLEAEAHRLAAEELGVHAEILASLGQTKRDQALMNLTVVFDKEKDCTE